MRLYRIKNKAVLLSVFINILLFILFYPPVSFSAEWRVTPIRLDFGKDAKSGVLTIVNEGEERLHVQMKAYEWTQDANGKDQYTETNDIIFFPKIIVIEKKEERILRAGIKIPAVAKEKTYRLFIEEIPEPKKTEGAHVAIAIRFGVPIFVKPLKEEAKGEIGRIDISKGVFNAVVKNTGNMHFIINSINIKGKNLKGEDIFSKELAGWYLLCGASRLYTTSIPGEVCENLKRIDIEVKTDKFILNGNLDANRTMCLP